MSNYVFVLDKDKQPLDPTHPAKARKLLKVGRAKVFRRYPFTIIMQDLEVKNCVTHKQQLKIDPGSNRVGCNDPLRRKKELKPITPCWWSLAGIFLIQFSSFASQP